MSTAATLPHPPRLARAGVAAVFLLNGAAIANWLVRIPDVKASLGLSAAALGLVLLATTAGSLTAMPLAGGLASRLGSRPVTTFLAFAFSLSLVLPGLAPSVLLLVPALFVLGAFNGGLDVAMNSQAAAVERAYRRPIMSSFHALWSAGGLAGAAIGGWAAGAGISPALHLGATAAVTFLLMIVATRPLLPASTDAAPDGPAFALPTRPLLAVGAVAFFALVGEGAVGDWSAVYLRESLGSGAAMAAAGYAAFSLAMAAGRFAGDYLSHRFGAVAVVRAGGLAAAAGILAAVVAGEPLVAVVGFGLAGLGFSIVFPNALSAAGRTRGMPAGASIAAVSTMGYTGFLAGPPIIGLVSQATSLSFGLITVLAASLAIAALAGALSVVRPLEHAHEATGATGT